MPRRSDRPFLTPDRQAALRRGDRPALSELAQARTILARAIRDLPGGEKYLPLFEAADTEITRRHAEQADTADAVAAAIKYA